MDNKKPIIIELEKTSHGYTVNQIMGIGKKSSHRNPPAESNKIQISLTLKPQKVEEIPPNPPTPPKEKESMTVNLILPPPPPSPKKPGYEVFPHAQITPTMNQNMTPLEIKKEEVKEPAPQPQQQPEEKNANAPSQLTLSEIRKYPLVLPSCAQWFDLNKIHEIEQKALPEFFCGKFPSKSPQIYKEYRNFIVKLYRSNPYGYLSATTCRRHLAGDVCGIIRIHAFLEHWGIINFSVDPYLKPHKMSLSRAEALDTKVLVNSGGVITEKYTEPGKQTLKSDVDPQTLLSLGNAISALPKEKRPTCDFCGELCGLVWFTHKSGPKRHIPEPVNIAGNPQVEHDPFSTYMITLCEHCYEKENYPKLFTKSDFEMNSIKPTDTNEIKEPISMTVNEWAPEEILQLLNLVEKYKENWDKITEELKNNGFNRSKQECISKFMSLPIAESQTTKSASVTKESDIKTVGDSCFYDIGNPILMQVGLFAREMERYANDEDSKKEHFLRTKMAKIEENEQKEENKKIPDEKGGKILDREVVEKVKEKTIKRAQKLARKEKKEIKRLVSLILEAQIKKLECKMEFFNEFDSLLQNERQQIKALQAQLFAERINLSMNKSDLLSQTVRHKSFDATHKNSISSENKPASIIMGSPKPQILKEPLPAGKDQSKNTELH